MKIVFFRHSLLSRGGDRMVLAHAACLADDSHQVVIKTGRVDTVFAIDPRIMMEKIPLAGIAGTLLAAALESRSSSIYVADIVILSFLLSLRNRGRVLFFAQGYDEFNCSSAPGRVLIRSLLFCALALIRLPVFAVSEHLAVFLRKKYHADAIVVPNGIDPIFFARTGDGGYSALKSGRKAILLHARRDFAKGLDIAIAVMRRVAAEATVPVELWTVGENVEGVFNFIPHRDFGHVPADKLAQLMSSADVLFHPTRSEGFALIVLESFARLCPVVTTQAVFFAENEVNALVGSVDDTVQLAAHLCRLLDNEALGRSLASRGYEVARCYGLAESSEKFKDALVERFATGAAASVGG